MKKHLLLLIVVLATLYSCTNDENPDTTLNPDVSNIIQKNYNNTLGHNDYSEYEPLFNYQVKAFSNSAFKPYLFGIHTRERYTFNK